MLESGLTGSLGINYQGREEMEVSITIGMH